MKKSGNVRKAFMFFAFILIVWGLFLTSYVIAAGTQSHDTHLNDPKGPLISDCSVCHLLENPVLFADGNPLATTTVCDLCHSLGGTFDGVNDAEVGAKPNWDDGIYESAVPPEEWPSRLKAGKENWCAGCHDDGISVIHGISAPNVMGDNTTYGYTVSGHGEYGVRCDACHDLTMFHTDGIARTYSASSDNYREGYRLNEDMAVPRNGAYGPIAFALCVNCHEYSDITGPTSNFRNDNTGVQLHETHLSQSFAQTTCWDSDWNENFNNCNQSECADSAISCTACHNVHGSPTPAMIRHGELISTPGTTDKVPALRFRWYKEDGLTQTMILGESRWGSLLCGFQYNLSINHVCWDCHNQGELRYYRAAPLPIPVIDKIRGVKEPGLIVRIIGTNFGDTQGNSIVHIGPRIFDSSSPKIKLWSDTKIKIRLLNYQCGWFKDPHFRYIKTWVTVDGIDSNKKRLKVMKPSTCSSDSSCTSCHS
jgi:hypothetical protein